MTDVTSLLREANPVPESSAPWSDSESAQRMLVRIMETPDSGSQFAPRKRRIRPAFLIPAVIALSASGALIASSVAGSKTIEVNAVDAQRHPAQVEETLAREGITAHIVNVPAKPSLVGKWFHLYFPAHTDIAQSDFDILQAQVGVVNAGALDYCAQANGGQAGTCERSATLSIPGSFRGEITLVTGRAAQPGEEYWADNVEWDNELAPSGAFYCLRLEEKSPHEIDTTLQSMGYSVIWVDESGANEPVDAPPPGAEVTWTWMRDPQTVDVRLASGDQAEKIRETEGTPSNAHPRSTAASWAPSC